MSPPVARPLPRFIADAMQEALPYGRWAELLAERFRAACAEIEELPDGAPAPSADEIEWFPERGWGGRFYVPATARAELPGPTGGTIEYYGHVSFARPGDGEPRDFAAWADFTDVFAADNPGWTIDLNDDVIGAWRGEAGRRGDVTLIWGKPLVRGAYAATAELEGEATDQSPVMETRFTLLAVDAIKGFGDDLCLEVKIWNNKNQELASESLYDEPADVDPA
jgi:hypothetical protein